jgi:tetratricopeptide (TPR) repeat protein
MMTSGRERAFDPAALLGWEFMRTRALLVALGISSGCGKPAHPAHPSPSSTAEITSVNESSPAELAAQLTANPADAELMAQMKGAAEAAKSERRYEDAYVLFRALADVDSEYWTSIRELQVLMGPKRTKVSVLMFALARATDPAEKAKIERLLAQGREERVGAGAVPRSQSELEHALAKNPDDAQTRFELIKVYRSSGMTQKAAVLLEEQGDRYSEQGYIIKAMGTYRQAVNLDSDRLDLWEKLTLAEETLELDEDAEAHLEQLAARYKRLGMATQHKAVHARLAVVRKRAKQRGRS